MQSLDIRRASGVYNVCSQRDVLSRTKCCMPKCWASFLGISIGSFVSLISFPSHEHGNKSKRHKSGTNGVHVMQV